MTTLVTPSIRGSGGEAADVLYESQALLTSELTAAPMLIPGVLSQQDKIVCFAAPGVGKSILAQQLASCLVSGKRFLHFDVPVNDDARVLYVAGEGDVDELQSRGRRMGESLPVGENRLWYWPYPNLPMNTAAGFRQLVVFALDVRPLLVIFDPIYALMKGSMREDEDAGDFLRNMNRLQQVTGAAVMLTHHTHRPVRDDAGDVVEEGPESYFGSILWHAWARTMWAMRRDGSDHHYVSMTCVKDRNRRSGFEREEMMLVEPSPLMFVERDKTLSATMHAIREVLKRRAMTLLEIEAVTERKRSTLYETLAAMKTRGIVIGDGAKPEHFTLA